MAVMIAARSMKTASMIVVMSNMVHPPYLKLLLKWDLKG